MGNCFTHNSLESAGALLDEIFSQSECGLYNRLYKIINYQKGGKLIEAYHRGGSKEVESLAKKELKEFMYDDGKGMMLTYEYYHKWKSHNKNEVFVEMDDSSISNNVPKFTERQICWTLENRGLLGESILHVLILCNSKIHTRIARVLLRLYPNLAWDIIEGEEYYGASALHLAIAYRNTDLMKQLVESGSDVNQRATGRFFQPHDQQQNPPKKKTSFLGLCYLGEYPLAWAACCDDEPAYNLLLARGGDPNMQDSFGNMILHMVVIRDKWKIYGYALRHPQKPAKDNILNNHGLTPLTLACKLGRNKIFREMLELSAIEFWRYSNITCSGYPLNALDTILPNGKTNWNSALMIILDGQTNEHLDMLDGGVIQRLLEEKWKTFARHHFLKRLALVFLHLVTFSIAVYLRPTAKEPLLKGTDVRSICRYCAEIVTCLGCISVVIYQQGQEILAQGFVGFLFNLTNPSKAIFLISNVLILVCIPCRILGERDLEDSLLAIALPCTWFFLIFFAGAVRLTGPFITMIYSMLAGDMIRFGIIYVIFLLGFTQAFFFLFKSSENDRFASFPQTWMSLFHMTLGYYEYGDLGQTYYPMMTRLVFVAFMVIVPILLLNMLIAMMGNTYCKVIIQSEREWMRQWAKILVALERAIDQKRAKEFLASYSISLGTKDDSTQEEQRAVMVIKSKLKSKARQRKGALMNWKRIKKRIVQEVRACGGTADGVHQKFRAQAKLSAPKLNYMAKSDESETEGAPAMSKKDGLGDALSQLVFAHDLDITFDPSLDKSPTPSRKTSPLESEQIVKSPTASNNESPPLESKTIEEPPTSNRSPSNSYQALQVDTGSPVTPSDQNLTASYTGVDNPAFIPETDPQTNGTTSVGSKVDNAQQEVVSAQDNDAIKTLVNRQLPKIKIKKRHRRKHLLRRSKIGVIEEEEVEDESNGQVVNGGPRSRTTKKQLRTKSARHMLRQHRREEESTESEVGLSCSHSSKLFRHRKRVKKSQKANDLEVEENCENHNRPKPEILPWSTENVVAMTSIVRWEDDIQMF